MSQTKKLNQAELENNRAGAKQSASASEETIQSSQERDTQLANHIHFAVEMESTFKLYSYRIISHEQFQDRIQELIHHLNRKNQ